jgi:hypothetical protein
MNRETAHNTIQAGSWSARLDKDRKATPQTTIAGSWAAGLDNKKTLAAGRWLALAAHDAQSTAARALR